jgi:acetylornithine deacetylase/succinyl-diaminopimelate desuccinylase-like protein
VPDWCRLTIDRRFLLEEKIGEVKAEVTSILDRLKRERSKFDYEIRDIMEVQPTMTEHDAPVVKAVSEAIREIFDREPEYVISPAPTTRSMSRASANSTIASLTAPASSTSRIGRTNGSASTTWSSRRR